MVDKSLDNGLMLSNIDQRALFDECYSHYNGFEGGKFARPIKRWLSEHNIFLPDQPKLLGLGAGLGNPDFGLAESLGIKYENVTLVDRNPAMARHPIIVEHRQGVRYLAGRGIIHYLEQPDDRYNIVTAIGIEFVLEDPEFLERFIRALPNILLPNGFVCIYPEVHDMQDKIWTACGFEEVNDLGPKYDYNASRMYVYNNSVKK